MLQWPSPASPVPSLALYSPGQSTPNLGLFTMLHLFSFPVATVSHAGGSQLTAPCKLQDPGSVRTQVPGHGTPWGWRQDVNCISLAPRLGSEAANCPGFCTWRHHLWPLSWSCSAALSYLVFLKPPPGPWLPSVIV